MNKKLLFILLSIAWVCIFISCNKQNIDLESISLAKKHYLSADTTLGVLTVSIQVEMPVKSQNNEIAGQIREDLITEIFGEQYINISNDSIAILFFADLVREYTESSEPFISQIEDKGFGFFNEHLLEGFSLLNDKKIFSYGVDRFVFMGGAHGQNNRFYYNYDASNAERITESDIFTSGFEKELIEIIKQRLVEDSENLKTIADLDNSYYWVDSIRPNGNFYISDEGITYVYNPYDIAPYYVGIVEVLLPYSKIKQLLMKDSIIAYLIKE